MIGQTINNYILERKLGEGGMGTVYFARHNRIDRVVAVKVLHQTLFTQTSIRNRFKNEANALIKLGHPNIVKLFDYVEQDDLACLIMEYIEGFTLDDYITKVTGPLPAPKATHIINSVLDAVQYAHEKNIFHRDIKPGNIMVSKDGKTVKIMDFGIAKFTDDSNLKTTHANAQLGTPFYMSPEQVKGLRYSALSDIYSLGVTLFEMVTGKCPYREITNLFELQSKIVNEPLPPTSKYYPNVTPKIQEAIKIATNKTPEQRFKNCNEFKSYLLEIEKPQPGLAQKQTPVPKPVPQQPKQKTRRPQPVEVQPIPEEKKNSYTRIYLLVLLAVLVIGGIIYSSLNQSNSHLSQSKVTPVFTPVKESIGPGSAVKVPDNSRDSIVAKTNEAGNKNNTPKQPKVSPDVNLSSASKTGKTRINKTNIQKKDTTKKQSPPPLISQNVRSDLINYLGARKSFGGIQYDDISQISITSVGNKVYYEETGTTSYDVDITINGQNRRCQVIYILNSDKPKVNLL